jgi:hypothetical protein
MAVLRKGLFGGVSGKLGNTVSYMVNGRNVIRMVGRSSKPPTDLQLANRQAMRVICAVLKAANPFVRLGFEAAASAARIYPQNKAVSVNKPAALKGVYPNIEVDYPKLVLSMGTLSGLDVLDVVLDAGAVSISWAPVLEGPDGNDRVMAFVYFPELTDPVIDKACVVLSGTRRSAGMERIPVPPALLNERMEVYIAMRCAEGLNVSDSQYVGRIN